MTSHTSHTSSTASAHPSSAATETIDELRTLIMEAEQALANAGDAADDKLVEIRDRLQSVLDDSKSAIGKLRKTAIAQAKKADEVVRTHPYETIGIALGVGALLGFLISSRRN